MFITILLSAFAATTMMTVFSYLTPEGFRKNYKEPMLFQHLITHSPLRVTGIKKKIASWVIHYCIGLIFVFFFFMLWRTRLFAMDWISGIIFGLVTGAVGITGWEAMHIIYGYPVSIDFKGFHIHQFFAHIIFGLTTMVSFLILI
jgi:hypothetical protein